MDEIKKLEKKLNKKTQYIKQININMILNNIER